MLQSTTQRILVPQVVSTGFQVVFVVLQSTTQRILVAQVVSTGSGSLRASDQLSSSMDPSSGPATSLEECAWKVLLFDPVRCLCLFALFF